MSWHQRRERAGKIRQESDGDRVFGDADVEGDLAFARSRGGRLLDRGGGCGVSGGFDRRRIGDGGGGFHVSTAGNQQPMPAPTGAALPGSWSVVVSLIAFLSG